MGLSDLFRSAGSGGNLGEDDRKRIFWYLKRTTSYTAWARAAQAFNLFADVYRRQVFEEGRPRGATSGSTQWDLWYADILRAQVWFEQGLKRLRRGDRSVWLHDRRGVLADALLTGAHWYTELLFGGERCDHQYFGKYLEEIKQAITRFNAVQRDVGYLQSRMIDTPAPLFWGEWLQCVLENRPYPRSPIEGLEPEMQSSPLSFPDPLPEVPDAGRRVLVSTGERVPVDGIWEPQVKSGCMNYMVNNTEALLLNKGGGSRREVVWRLIWEDRRYLDDDIPVEECLYFPTDTASGIAPGLAAPELITAVSGEPCPRTGRWAAMEEIGAETSLAIGRRMPQSYKRDVTWVWVAK